MSKYYVRAPGAESADGPFSVEQLRELASSDLVKPETLFKSDEMDEFVSIGDQPDLWEQIKAKPGPGLKLRKKEDPSAGTGPSETESPAGKKQPKKKTTPTPAAPPPPTSESGNVDEMLAAAEGKTAQTRHIQSLRKSRDRAVALLLPGVVLMLLLSIGGIVQPVWEQIYDMFQSGEYSISILFDNWTLAFAIVDLVLAIGIGLGQTALFPLLRFRAALGIGFFAYLFYSRGDPGAIAALSALQLGMICSTLCTRFGTTFLSVVLGLAGGGTFIWLAWFRGIPL